MLESGWLNPAGCAAENLAVRDLQWSVGAVGAPTSSKKTLQKACWSTCWRLVPRTGVVTVRR